MAFNDDAISHALREYRVAKTLKDPFSWFFSVAKTYSLDNEISIDYNKADMLCLKKGMPKDAKYVLPGNLVPRIADKSTRDILSRPEADSFKLRSINQTEEYIKAAIAVESGATSAYEKAFGCKPPVLFAKAVGGPAVMSDNAAQALNDLCEAYTPNDESEWEEL